VETAKELKLISSQKLEEILKIIGLIYLARNGVRFADLVTPIATTNWNN
jgi:hypothetical protein